MSVVSGAQQQECYGREPGIEMLQLITRLTDILIAGFGFSYFFWERVWRQFLGLKDSGYEDPLELQTS